MNILAEFLTIWFILGFVGWMAIFYFCKMAGAKLTWDENISLSGCMAFFGVVPFFSAVMFMIYPEQLMFLRMAIIEMRNKPRPPAWRITINRMFAGIGFLAQCGLLFRIWTLT